jgi:uncharacterized membrane protein
MMQNRKQAAWLARCAGSIRANILVGFFLTIPVVATVLIFNFVFRLTTSWLPKTILPDLQHVWNGYLLRLITLLATILILYLVGVLTRNFMGRRLYRLGDTLLARIPLIRNIYISVRQVSAALFTQRKTLFKQVVLIEYPRKGLYSLAFSTAEVPSAMTAQFPGIEPGEACISLFVPTTPNPTSGVLLVVPRREVTPLHIPIADALTFVMSAGAVAPGENSNPGAPTLLDKLESWLGHGETTEGEVAHG